MTQRWGIGDCSKEGRRFCSLLQADQPYSLRFLLFVGSFRAETQVPNFGGDDRSRNTASPFPLIDILTLKKALFHLNFLI